MPISELTLLGFTAKEDSQNFQIDLKDPTIRDEMDGGFVSTRARFTRSVSVITTGWTDIPESQCQIFRAWLRSKRVGAGSFAYSNPVSGEVVTVRFAAPPQLKYAGIGGIHRWDITNVKLEEV